ncbi:MAG TPA: hypothetical protein VKT81_18285 [Bryobacteraceae bacterium]|nr:hypothetical protein [Bryobacteraceae bacterium]
MRASVAGLAFAILSVGSAHAQYTISARSGVVQYVEGTAYLNDNPVEPKIGNFPNMKDNEVFRTTEGMAEVLLTPGVFLRMSENSAIRMISNKLTDTRVEILSGSAMVESDEIDKELSKEASVTLLYKGSSMLLVKHGLYRVDAEQGLFKVYDGEAIVKGDSGQLTLHKGKETVLTGALMAVSFDTKADDELYRWSDRRSGYMAKANVSSANSLMGGGYSALGYPGFGGFSGFGGCSGLAFGLPWQFNPMFGMYTYVPCNGFGYSPFGYGFYSPYDVWQAPYYGGGGGGRVGPTRTPGISHTGTGTGKHTPFIPSRGATAASRSAGGYSGGGYSGGGASRSSGVSLGSVSSGSVSRGGGSSGGGTAHGGH